MNPGRYNAGPTQPRNTDQDTKTGGLLSTQQTADQLLEAYQRAAEEDLKTRRRFEQRLAGAERRKQKRAGHLAELSVTLDIPRRYWPAVHQAALALAVPIRTERLAREQTTPLTITTSKSGALRLRATVPELQEHEATA